MKTYKQKFYHGDEDRILVTSEFVKQNKLQINLEVAKNIVENPASFFCFELEVAINFLSFGDAKKYFTDEYLATVSSGKAEHHQITDVLEATQDFLDYMVFAWSKAMDERGLSASRSITKLATWMRILDRPDVAEVLENDELYNPYGRRALRKACEMLGIICPSYL